MTDKLTNTIRGTCESCSKHTMLGIWKIYPKHECFDCLMRNNRDIMIEMFIKFTKDFHTIVQHHVPYYDPERFYEQIER